MDSVYLEVALYAALLVLGLTFIWLEAKALGRHRGARRWIAIVAAVVVAWIVADVVANPAAHPLWPMDIILWLVPAVLVLILIRGVR